MNDLRAGARKCQTCKENLPGVQPLNVKGKTGRKNLAF
jgi:hypothetical protein